MKPHGVTILAACLMLAGCGRQQAYLAGEVDATEIDVGVKIAGRISRIVVHEGDRAARNQILGYLENREMGAKLQAALAGREDAVQQLDLAQKTFDRISNLYASGVVAKQQFDEASYKHAAAQQKLKAADGQLGEVQAYYDEMIIKAPMDGEVTSVVSNPGELVSPGYPVVTMTDLADQWVVFNLREDLLKDIAKGTTLKVSFPALGPREYDATVTYISALGNFAKWKSTNEQGSFDLKTFEVRARPATPITNLRPGMSARIRVR